MLLDAEALRRWFKVRQKAALKRRLRDLKVPFWHDAQEWPITTLAALERRLVEQSTRPDWSPYESQRRTPEKRFVVSRSQKQVDAAMQDSRGRGGAICGARQSHGEPA